MDGLRALAVATVLIYHFGTMVGVPGVPGDLGVTLFFVLSGFLITWLLRREWQATGTVSLRAFYARRTLRIFPAYYVFLAIMGSLMLVGHRRWPVGQGWAALVYLTNYYDAFTHGGSSSIAHTWSLAVEEQFYLLWPLAFIALARKGRRTIIAGLAITIAAVLAWRITLIFGLHAEESYSYHAFDTRADALAIGCLLAVVLETQRGQALAEWLTVSSLQPIWTVAALILARLAHPLFHPSVGYTLEAFLCAVLIVQALRLTSAAWFRWLEHPATTYIGRISYPLYLYHGIPAFLLASAPLPAWAKLAGMVLASIVMASGSYYLVERPFLRLKSRVKSVPTPRGTPLTPHGGLLDLPAGTV